MQNTVHTQIQSSPSPVLEKALQSPGFFGAGAVRGLIHVDLSDIYVDRGDIAKAILKGTRESGKLRVVMIYDVGDDIFMIKPKQMPLSDEELNEKLSALGIKYDPEEGEIVEVPFGMWVVEIFDGLGTTTLVLKRRK